MVTVQVTMYGEWRTLAEGVSDATADRIIAYGKKMVPTKAFRKI